MGIGLTLMWCRFTAQGRWASSLLIRSILRILGFNAGSRFSCKMAWISDSWTLSSSVQECRDTACEKGKKYHQKRNVLLSKHLNIDLRMQQLLLSPLNKQQQSSLCDLTDHGSSPNKMPLWPPPPSSIFLPSSLQTNNLQLPSRKCYKNMDFSARVVDCIFKILDGICEGFRYLIPW